MSDKKPLVEMINICKHFAGLQALSNASLELFPGEVLGLLGHNGAGKSTLIKVLAGAHGADLGEIKISGESVEFENPNNARA